MRNTQSTRLRKTKAPDLREQNRLAQATYRARHADSLRPARAVMQAVIRARDTSNGHGHHRAAVQRVAKTLRDALPPADLAVVAKLLREKGPRR